MKKEGNAEFQYIKIPYGEDVFVKLGSECICAHEAAQNSAQMERNHFHNLMEIGVCRWGTGEVILDKKKCPYKTGDILIVPQNSPHRIASQAKEESFWEFMYLKPSLFLERIYRTESRKREIMMQEVECQPFLIARENAKVFASELDLILDKLRVKECEYQNCVRGLLFALLVELVILQRKNNEKAEHMHRYNAEKINAIGMAMEYIEKNYAKNLHVSDIAQAGFVSESYLRRLFAECCSVSPMQYLKQIRVEAACKLLKEREENINIVAYKVGYVNISTFINHFKEITGTTPRRWRQNYK